MSADTLVHTRDNPWYGVGNKVDAAMDVEQALKLGGLDWAVEKRPAGYLDSAGRFSTIPDKYAVVRTDTDEWLGQVGKNYKLFQNSEAFAFANGLVDGGLEFDSAGTYKHGKRMFLAARIPESVQVLGEDPYDVFLFLTTSHDGKSAITASVIEMRLRCTNMIQLALRNARTKWTIRHTSSAVEKMEEARQSLALTFKAMDAFDLEMETLVGKPLQSFELQAAVEHVLPDTPQRAKKIDRVLELFNESPNLEEYRGTRYAGLQAFAEWLDWGRDVRNDHARFEVSFDGYGARYRNELHQLLVA